MPAETGEARSTELRWPRAWSMIFRAFALARDPSKIAIAAAAVVVLTIGWALLGWIFGQDGIHGRWPANADRGPNPFLVVLHPQERQQLYTSEFWVGRPGQAPPLQVEPFRQFFQPVVDLVLPRSVGHWFYSFLGVALTLVVWGLAAGAITRIAAVQIARQEHIGLGEGLRYGRKKLLDYIIGPAIPLVVIAFLVLLNAIGGLLNQIPYVGIIVIALLLFLPVISGLIIAFMVVAFIGWPLFYATISAEGTDSFDALSRTLSYITQRAWSFVKYVFVAVVYGLIVIFIVVFFASFTVYLVRWSVGLIPPAFAQDTVDPVGSMFTLAPKSYQWRELLVGQDHPLVRFYERLNGHLLSSNRVEEFKQGLAEKKLLVEILPENVSSDLGLKDKPLSESQYATLAEFYRTRTADDLRHPDAKFEFIWAYMNWGQKTAAAITGFWTHVLFLLLVGFAFSFFWCSGTIIYFLLRREVDDTGYEEVYIEDEDELIPPMPPPPADGPTTEPPSPPVPAPPTPENQASGSESLPATVPPKLSE
jgi:hypothetical protein